MTDTWFVAVLCMLGDNLFVFSFKYSLVFCFFFLVNFIHCAKTAVVYSRRPPGVSVFIFTLRPFNSTSNRVSWQIRASECSLIYFLWRIDIVAELSWSKRTQHEKEKQAKSYRRDPEYQRALSLKLDWIWTARDRPLQMLKNTFTTILQSFSPDNQTVTFHISWFSPVFLNSWQYVMMDDMTAAQKVKPKHLDCPNYSSESTSARRLVSLSEFEPFGLFFYILKV